MRWGVGLGWVQGSVQGWFKLSSGGFRVVGLGWRAGV